MTTLRSATPATSAMRAVLPRFITPVEIARDPATTVFAVMEPRFVTGAGSVSQVANLSRPEAPFVQVAAANQPAMAMDSALGRQTLTFGSDRNDFLTMTGAVNYAAAWSMLAVVSVGATGLLMNIMGDYDSALTGQAAMQLNSNGSFRAKVAEAAVGLAAATVGQRYALFVSHDGAGVVKGKRLDTATATSAANISTMPTTTALKLGHQTGSWGLNGTIDMAAMFSVDILAPAQADLLSRVETMLRQYYGAAAVGGA